MIGGTFLLLGVATLIQISLGDIMIPHSDTELGASPSPHACPVDDCFMTADYMNCEIEYYTDSVGCEACRCKDRTPPNQSDCFLPKDEGRSCKPSHYHLLRLFYNPTSGSCEEFQWGFCGGNKNRFRTKQDCEKLCLSDPTTITTTTKGTTPHGAGTDATKGTTPDGGIITAKPTITWDPSFCHVDGPSSIICSGSPTITCYAVDGTHVTSIEIKKDGTTLESDTGSSYLSISFSGFDADNAGEYKCVVTDTGGVVTTSAFQLKLAAEVTNSTRLAPHLTNDVKDSATDIASENADDAAFKALDDADVCPVTGFTGREKKLIWASWKAMTPDANARRTFGINLVLWLFENVPHMRDRFNKFDANADREQLVVDEMFLQQTQKIVTELHKIISLLPSPDKLAARVTAMAKSHLSKTPVRIGTKYFGPFHQKFDQFVSAGLNEPSDAEIVQLWVKLIGVIYKVVEAEEAKLEPADDEAGEWL